MANPSNTKDAWRMWSGVVAWAGFPALHGLWMLADWSLRDPALPMSGGIPNSVTSAFQGASLIGFAILIFASLGRVRLLPLRLLITLVAVSIGAGGMILGWLSYVIHNGIDTL
ncbi:hypothetical protein [Haloferula sp. A504]|uniref:hypothetical protein n=1 Tax=Haloferula sp. A504 TaxID=3373601 RepID=UPI0031C8E0A4|nr:hypothetical protein [Verrucomicrobiaceae bacterium E54]